MTSESNTFASFIDEALEDGEDQRESRSAEEAIDNAIGNENTEYSSGNLVGKIDDRSGMTGITDAKSELLKDRIERLSDEEDFYSVTVDIEALADSEGVIPEGKVDEIYDKVHRMLEDSTADVIYADDDWKTIGIIGNTNEIRAHYGNHLDSVEIEEGLPGYKL
ncbi:hypothetical protein [Candidatus Nanohalobium constans]|uniref:Uncharacterized protein n=1 Tax=Candidatus Nanohalobium constans TaxID=2565781 RepID=A0A5Q0UI66_9ARCH|nr:hypothetical protein [Candidatus Nanohalobium constans]QGA80569.1 hypothetical protein LC1Nh_0679 [Candidatus Nanohalobium constans]